MENNNKEENREFYVYKHIRKDNNTCFYVGKGKSGRIYKPKRNKHYNRIRKKYGCYVVKIKENLTEKEAFALEREIIEDYVFVFGYGINIKGYYKGYNEIGHLTNCTWGGEGVSGGQLSEEHKKKISEKVSGEKNGMWGKPSPNRSKVICTTTGKIFDCIKDAEKHYKCSNISSCCRKKTQSAGKLNGTPLQWKYVKDYNNDCKGILINPIIK